MNLTNLWWSLPNWLTNLIQPTNKTSITLVAYKQDGGWYFNAPSLLTWKESLVFTNVLDQIADGDDHVSLTVSTYPMDGAMHLWYEGDDALDQTASIYVWGTQTVWLCGWLPWYFGTKPSDLWVTASKG